MKWQWLEIFRIEATLYSDTPATAAERDINKKKIQIACSSQRDMLEKYASANMNNQGRSDKERHEARALFLSRKIIMIMRIWVKCITVWCLLRALLVKRGVMMMRASYVRRYAFRADCLKEQQELAMLFQDFTLREKFSKNYFRPESELIMNRHGFKEQITLIASSTLWCSMMMGRKLCEKLIQWKRKINNKSFNCAQFWAKKGIVEMEKRRLTIVH